LTQELMERIAVLRQETGDQTTDVTT